MQIEIDIKKLTMSPLEDQEFLISDFNTKSNDLVKKIILSTPASYLVSGYRGVGKTSFINQFCKNLFEESNKINESYLVIKLNVGKYKGFSNVLRSVIRSLYYEIDNLSKQPNMNNLKFSDTYKELKLIFTQTFKDVKITESLTIIDEKLFKTNYKIGMKQLLVAFTPLATVLIDKILTITVSVPFLISSLLTGIWAISSLAFFSYENKKMVKNQSDFITSNLYDDEIAEYRLMNILKKMKDELNIETVFIIDELDKIVNNNEIEDLINEFKPFMLSGISNFLFITGQQMHYKYHYSKVNDDQVITSLFSSIEHISLPAKKDFFEIFKGLLKNEKDFKRNNVRMYLNSKILQSNKIPRKFIAAIKEDISVDKDNKCFLNIDDKEINFYKTDSTILQQLNVLEKSIKEKKLPEGIHDFLIMQLYMWTHKAKMLGRFNLSNLFEETELDMELSYLSKILSEYMNLFIATLSAQNLIKMEHDNDESYYTWTNKASIKEEIKKEDNYRYQILESFEQVKKIVKVWEDRINSTFGNNDENILSNNKFQEYLSDNFSPSVVKNFLNILDNSNSDTRNVNLKNFSSKDYFQMESNLNIFYSNFSQKILQDSFMREISETEEFNFTPANNNDYGYDFELFSHNKSIVIEYKFLNKVNKGFFNYMNKNINYFISELNNRQVEKFITIIFCNITTDEFSEMEKIVKDEYISINNNLDQRFSFELFDYYLINLNDSPDKLIQTTRKLLELLNQSHENMLI
ncbi:hypothetical protein [Lysinibacillus sphaericus]|uniref:hypothetical protein n=1 Tax=Lysinibacillus sphaericus TaxID=1421 RepID=UPI003D7FA7B4